MDLTLKCSCGCVQGTLTDVRPQNTNRAVCYCGFCQSYQRYLGNEAVALDNAGGSEVFQISPRDIHIEQGQEHVKAIRLTGKGAIRFFASCCNTPLANTTPSLNIPFVGVSPMCVESFKDEATREVALGPVRARVNGKGSEFTQLPKTDRWSSTTMLIHLVKLLAFWKLRGDAKRSPFRSKSGEPIIKPERVRISTES